MGSRRNIRLRSRRSRRRTQDLRLVRMESWLKSPRTQRRRNRRNDPDGRADHPSNVASIHGGLHRRRIRRSGHREDRHHRRRPHPAQPPLSPPEDYPLTYTIRILAKVIAAFRESAFWDVLLTVFWLSITLLVVMGIIKRLYLMHWFLVNS